MLDKDKLNLNLKKGALVKKIVLILLNYLDALFFISRSVERECFRTKDMEYINEFL